MDRMAELTHRSVEPSFAVHGQVQAAVHPPDADQPHSQADELQDTCTGGAHHVTFSKY